MSSLNSVGNCRYSIFSKKMRVLKRLKKKRKKSGLEPPFMHTTDITHRQTKTGHTGSNMHTHI